MALDLIDAAIADLEAKLNLPPGGVLTVPTEPSTQEKSNKKEGKKNGGGNGENKKKGKNNNKKKEGNKAKGNVPKKGKTANVDQPDICKLEFKVGQITKVWVHPEADKLYCEEIECGEEAPRQIASGLRPHYTLEEMEGRRLLVVSNLKVSGTINLLLFCFTSK
jgi:aminoacyl tRNA synthase complex-interacting multifunctional protein 1